MNIASKLAQNPEPTAQYAASDLRYRAEIDGLRAVAVIPVILFHAGFEYFSGGFVGVDVFFVISGYLITSILVADLENGRFSIARFYERRARRILPALFFVLLVCIPFAALWMSPSQLEDFSQSLFATSLFISNIHFWSESGYFEAAAEARPLLHTWSLAVEEQFYLIFPLLLFILWRFGRRPACYAIAGIAGMSFLLSEWGWENAPEANFYLSHARAWELLAGSICAFVQLNPSSTVSNVFSAVGAALILAAVFLFDESTPFPSYFTLMPVAGTALIILFADKDTWLAKVLSFKFLVAIGLISYSAYLWHQPLFAFARIRFPQEPDSNLMGMLAFASLPLAYFSWRYVEKPFRSNVTSFGKRNLGNWLMLAVGTGILVTSAVVSFDIMSKNTEEKIFLALASEKDAHFYTLSKNAVEELTLNELFDDGNCKFATTLDVLDRPRWKTCVDKYSSAIVIIGDSHARDLYQAAAFNSDDIFLVGLPRGGCRPVKTKAHCKNHYEALKTWLIENRMALKGVIYNQAGNWLSAKRIGQEFTPTTMGVDRGAIRETIQYLVGLSDAGIPVTFIGPRVEHGLSKRAVFNAVCEGQRNGLEAVARYEDFFDKLDRTIEREAVTANIPYVSIIRLLHFNVDEDLTDCSTLFWSNEDHWSRAGEYRFGNRLRSIWGN